ncbi:MAG: serine/threonine-protein kinase [Proteobacteria bacterium]|nr:serine/threonine-protein kinase [Pseudomonadota bacterium]
MARSTLVGTTILDRYVVEDELGAGAMGVVYRARHRQLERVVAVKVLNDELTHDPTIVARFHREAMAAARLQHPNVVAVLDVGTLADGRQAMVMELAQGQTLAEIITIHPTRERVIRIVRGILRGLEHAHDHGVVHRDLKPDNIIVEFASDGAELPRILDFGVAVLYDDESTANGRLTASGIIVGTPQYMAPEQAKGEAIDHRVDLFALGVMVYEMLAGVPPFTGTAMEVALANIAQDPPPIATRAKAARDAVDPLLERFARKLMARRLSERFASAYEVLETLALLERDRAAAALALGIMDVPRALALVALPPPPKR